MDGVLFTIPDWLDYADFNNYPSEENPTTNADFIDYANNQNILLGALVAAVLWQPNTNFIAGKIIISPNMPEGMEAVALTGGVTGTAEPAWESGTEEYQDGGVKWQLRWKHWSKSVADIADLTTGATNRLPNKAYAVGNVVYTDSNLSVALKCTQAGTTSNTELDISTNVVGSSITDGSVVWEVIARSNVLNEGEVLPIANGGTGETTTVDVRKTLNTNIQTFYNFAQIGLTSNATELEVVNAMPANSMLFTGVNTTTNPNLEIYKNNGAAIFGRLLIKKMSSNNFLFEYFDSEGGGYFIATANTTTTALVYRKIALLEKVALKNSLSMPSNTVIELSFASGDTYVAPADGWFYIEVAAPNSNTICDLIAYNTAVPLSMRQRDNNGIHLRAYVPLAKGQGGKAVFENGTLYAARFIYAQSEV